MATNIITLYDENGNELIPTTREMAIYDANGVRLDNKLDTFSKQMFYKAHFHGLYTNFYNTSIESGRYDIYSSTMLNPPFSGILSGLIDVKKTVGGELFIEFRPWNEVDVYYLQYNGVTGWSGWKRNITTNNIIQSTLVGGADKVPSAEVTKALGSYVDELNLKTSAFRSYVFQTNYASTYSSPFETFKELYKTLSVNNTTCLISFVWNSEFKVLVQRYSDVWGSAIMFSYASTQPEYFYLQNNVWKRQVISTSDADWITAPIDTAKFETYATGSELKYKRIGDTIYIQGAVKPISTIPSGQSTSIFTLPVGYRPIGASVVKVCQGSTMNKWTMTITTGGNVNVGRYGITTEAQVDAGAWLPIYCSFAI